jgi:hypothetical protein
MVSLVSIIAIMAVVSGLFLVFVILCDDRTFSESKRKHAKVRRENARRRVPY